MKLQKKWAAAGLATFIGGLTLQAIFKKDAAEPEAVTHTTHFPAKPTKSIHSSLHEARMSRENDHNLPFRTSTLTGCGEYTQMIFPGAQTMLDAIHQHQETIAIKLTNKSGEERELHIFVNQLDLITDKELAKAALLMEPKAMNQWVGKMMAGITIYLRNIDDEKRQFADLDQQPSDDKIYFPLTLHDILALEAISRYPELPATYDSIFESLERSSSKKYVPHNKANGEPSYDKIELYTKDGVISPKGMRPILHHESISLDFEVLEIEF